MNLTPIYDPPEQPKPHPICLLMPSADEDELQSLTDDIRALGFLAQLRRTRLRSAIAAKSRFCSLMGHMWTYMDPARLQQPA
jgi:hypothetical protein